MPRSRSWRWIVLVSLMFVVLSVVLSARRSPCSCSARKRLWVVVTAAVVIFDLLPTMRMPVSSAQARGSGRGSALASVNVASAANTQRCALHCWRAGSREPASNGAVCVERVRSTILCRRRA
eukprot:3185383-Pyramimonas_sp.AAC.1